MTSKLTLLGSRIRGSRLNVETKPSKPELLPKVLVWSPSPPRRKPVAKDAQKCALVDSKAPKIDNIPVLALHDLCNAFPPLHIFGSLRF